jgi:hypothetical protein
MLAAHRRLSDHWSRRWAAGGAGGVFSVTAIYYIGLHRTASRLELGLGLGLWLGLGLGLDFLCPMQSRCSAM